MPVGKIPLYKKSALLIEILKLIVFLTFHVFTLLYLRDKTIPVIWWTIDLIGGAYVILSLVRIKEIGLSNLQERKFFHEQATSDSAERILTILPDIKTKGLRDSSVPHVGKALNPENLMIITSTRIILASITLPKMSILKRLTKRLNMKKSPIELKAQEILHQKSIQEIANQKHSYQIPLKMVQSAHLKYIFIPKIEISCEENKTFTYHPRNAEHLRRFRKALKKRISITYNRNLLVEDMV